MTGDSPPAIPIEAHPDPVAEYVVSSGRPRVTATNGAFDAAFDADPTDAPVEELFDRFGAVESTGDEDPETHVARGDDVGIRLGGLDADETYLVRIVPADDGAGYLVFTDVSGYLDGRAVGVGEVASALSHDLRNPLDVAKAHLRAARETGDREHFEAVDDAHERITQIVRDVLTLARGEAAVDASEPVAIADAVEDAWQSVETCRAELRTPDDLPATTGDPDRVRRLLENLFRNSVEHASAGPSGTDEADPRRRDGQPNDVTITVGALGGDDSTGAGFYVADDGPGIPPDERDAVFEPGYTTTGDGTGLGLAIVEHVAAAHGWAVALTDSRDGGARFEVRFSR